jgi:chaperonin cofactor prefoldin
VNASLPDDMSSRELINQLNAENKRLVQQLSEKERQTEVLQEQVDELQEWLAQASH